MAEKIINFYEDHKKGVWLSIGFITCYCIGRHNGYNSYKNVVIDTVKVIKKEFEITAF